MKWNVILQNPPSNNLGIYNVFDYYSFRNDVKELFIKQYDKLQ